MSVENLLNKKRSVPLTDNKSSNCIKEHSPNIPFYLKKLSIADNWSEFMPYKHSVPNSIEKSRKNDFNNFIKTDSDTCKHLSIFHIHTLHLHLLVSLTLLLVTHKCPQYLVVF